MSVPTMYDPDVREPLRIPMSREEYYALPESEPVYEWVDGEAIEVIIAIPSHADAVSELLVAIKSVFPDLKVIASAGLEMPSSVRIPDLMVVNDWPSDAKLITKPALVAVEVLSPSNWRNDLYRKADEYGEFGVRQYWTVDLVQRQITIRENVDGKWLVVQELTDDNPIAEVEIPDHGKVRLDLNRIIRG